jgi:hypothetical protein
MEEKVKKMKMKKEKGKGMERGEAIRKHRDEMAYLVSLSLFLQECSLWAIKEIFF